MGLEGKEAGEKEAGEKETGEKEASPIGSPRRVTMGATAEGEPAALIEWGTGATLLLPCDELKRRAVELGMA